jgi:hypothetical protein
MTVTLVSGDLGDLTLQMMADGTNWETITSGSTHNFTNTGNDLRWKITSSGTNTIGKIKIEY